MSHTADPTEQGIDLQRGSLVGIVYKESASTANICAGHIETFTSGSHVVIRPVGQQWFWPTRLEWPRIVLWKIYDPDIGTVDEFLCDLAELHKRAS